MSLENAPDDVKLAVDLIVLLEEHEIAPEIVLSALEIVRRDFARKMQEQTKKADAFTETPPAAAQGEKE